MDRLSVLARDVRRAADEVVKRVELMQDSAPQDYATQKAFLLDVGDALDKVAEAVDLAHEQKVANLLGAS